MMGKQITKQTHKSMHSPLLYKKVKITVIAETRARKEKKATKEDASHIKCTKPLTSNHLQVIVAKLNHRQGYHSQNLKSYTRITIHKASNH